MQPMANMGDRLTGQSQCDWREDVVGRGIVRERDSTKRFQSDRVKSVARHPLPLPAWLTWMTGSWCDRLAGESRTEGRDFRATVWKA